MGCMMSKFLLSRPCVFDVSRCDSLEVIGTKGRITLDDWGAHPSRVTIRLTTEQCWDDPWLISNILRLRLKDPNWGARSCFDTWSTSVTKSHLCLHIRCWGSTRAYSYCTEWCQEWEDRSGEFYLYGDDRGCDVNVKCQFYSYLTYLTCLGGTTFIETCQLFILMLTWTLRKCVTPSRPHTEQVTYPVPEPAPGLRRDRDSWRIPWFILFTFFHIFSWGFHADLHQ
jgi:hypothetical protein